MAGPARAGGARPYPPAALPRLQGRGGWGRLTLSRLLVGPALPHPALVPDLRLPPPARGAGSAALPDLRRRAPGLRPGTGGAVLRRGEPAPDPGLQARCPVRRPAQLRPLACRR